MPRLASFALLLALLPGCAPATPAVDPVAQLWSPRGLAVIEQADRVEVFRVSPYPGGPGPAIGDFAITATGPAPAPELRAALIKTLRDPATYRGHGKRCEFMPGVGLRLWRGDEAAELALCFSCDQLHAYVLGPDGARTHDLAGNFDESRAALVDLARRLLPDDPEIQALPPTRGH